MVSSPLRSRFSGGVFKLEFYTDNEIETIITRSAKILNIELEKDAAQTIASRSRFTPRTANYLLRRCRDIAQIENTSLTKELVEKAMNMLDIDSLGLMKSDRDILRTIIEKYKGGPVGSSTLAVSLSEEIGTIEEFHEPYLIQLGLIERTPRGRMVTEKAYKHLGL
jgi:Holliday junction DNA helicase RuvB